MSVATSMIPDQLVICNTCKERMSFQSSTFIEREGDVETVGLSCPHCNARVVAYRTNEHIRKLQEKVARETEKFRSKIVAGVPPNRADRKLRKAKRQLQEAFKAFNGI